MERETRLENVRLEEIQCLTRALYRDLRRNQITEASELEKSLQSDHEEATMEIRFLRALKVLIALLLMRQRSATEAGRNQVQGGSAKASLGSVQARQDKSKNKQKESAGTL